MRALQGQGRCFENAYNYLLKLNDEGVNRVVLVHGVVTVNRGKEKGLRDNHAWIEINDKFVIDPSIDPDKPSGMPKIIYYQLNKIKKTELAKYTYFEALENLLSKHHYGPWNE